VALAVALAGCTQSSAVVASPSQTAWVVQPSAGSGESADARGTAIQAKAAFDRVIQGALSRNAGATGQTVTAALEAAGFPRSSLQFSASKTSANLTPGSIMVSAQLGSSCLIGQWGAAVGGYHSVIEPALGSGGCLVGGGGAGRTPAQSGGQLGN
jgi:hypothetical protein